MIATLKVQVQVLRRLFWSVICTVCVQLYIARSVARSMMLETWPREPRESGEAVGGVVPLVFISDMRTLVSQQHLSHQQLTLIFKMQPGLTKHLFIEKKLRNQIL